MRAYKAMKKDQTCRGFKFEEGETYELEGYPVLCQHGFHFCKDLVLTLEYYPVKENINENAYAEIEILGDVEFEKPNKHKGVTNKMKVLRIIPDYEVNTLIDDNDNSGYCSSGKYNSGYGNSGDRNSGNYNSGYHNSGYGNSGYGNSGNYNSGFGNSGNCNSGNCNNGNRNSGNRNSGNRNSGNRNSGNRNSGDGNSGDGNSGNCNSGKYNSGYGNSGYGNSGNRNSGDWNSCDSETGFLNSEQSKTVRVFNKLCSREEWSNAIKPDFMYFQTDKELGYKGSFKRSFESASEEDIELLKALPNFDADVFFEISGIKINV